MNIKDLMIDDWVLFKAQKPKKTQIVAIDYTSDIAKHRNSDVWYTSDCFEPIPISPNLLLKNGFIKIPDGYIWSSDPNFLDELYIHVKFRHNGEIRIIEVCIPNFYHGFFRTINYVHEFQNLTRCLGIFRSFIV